jgi:hypothetical protein
MEASEVFTAAYCDLAYTSSATADAASLTKPKCSLFGDVIRSLTVERGAGRHIVDILVDRLS